MLTKASASSIRGGVEIYYRPYAFDILSIRRNRHYLDA